MPDKLAFQLHELDVGVVDLSRDLRTPVIIEKSELAGEIDLFYFRS